MIFQYSYQADQIMSSWWRHQMETFSALLVICAGNSPVSGEFPAQRPVTRSFDVLFDLPINERLSKHSWGLWLSTPSHPLWRQSNVIWSRWPELCVGSLGKWHRNCPSSNTSIGAPAQPKEALQNPNRMYGTNSIVITAAMIILSGPLLLPEINLDYVSQVITTMVYCGI